MAGARYIGGHDRFGFTTFCTDTHRARWRLVRVQLRVRTQMKGKGRCFPKRRIGGGQRVNRGLLCARAGSSCTLDFGVIHLVGRCRINPCPLISTDYQQIDVFAASHVAMSFAPLRLLQKAPSLSSWYFTIHFVLRQAIKCVVAC